MVVDTAVAHGEKKKLNHSAYANVDGRNSLDIIDIQITLITELERALAVLLAKRIRLVNLGVLGELTIRFHCSSESVRDCSARARRRLTVTRLVGRVLDDDVRLVILEIPEGEQDNVSLVDPHLKRG